MSKSTLTGKVAIVTGASRGIGFATALALSNKGAHVALAARTNEPLIELQEKITREGKQAQAFPTDITDQSQVKELINATILHWGKVDILIANAGQYIRSSIRDLTPQMIEKSMAVNFYGNIYSILEVLPHMLEQGCGHIVLVSSMDAKTPLVLDSPYVSAKAALSGFGDVLRQEMHGTGINVTTVFPGRIDTPMIANLKVPSISAKISADVVAKSIIKALEHYKACVLLPNQVHLLNLIQFLSPSLADRLSRLFHLHGWDIDEI